MSTICPLCHHSFARSKHRIVPHNRIIFNQYREHITPLISMGTTVHAGWQVLISRPAAHIFLSRDVIAVNTVYGSLTSVQDGRETGSFRKKRFRNPLPNAPAKCPVTDYYERMLATLMKSSVLRTRERANIPRQAHSPMCIHSIIWRNRRHWERPRGSQSTGTVDGRG